MLGIMYIAETMKTNSLENDDDDANYDMKEARLG
jgi:hypothetical protein